MRQRALFLARELTQGGAAFLATRLIRKLSSDYDIDVLIMGPCSPKMLREVPQQASVCQVPIHQNLRETREGARTSAALLLWTGSRPDLAVFDKSYDVLLSTSILPDWHTCLVHTMVAARRKLLFLVDESLKNFDGLPKGRQSAITLALGASSSVVAVSASLHEAMAQYCTALRHKPHIVLPPLLDEHVLSAPHQVVPRRNFRNRIEIVTVARLIACKRLIDCLHIHHQLREEGLDIEWHVLGDGEQRERIAAEIERLGMQDSFILHGFQRDVSPWLHAADFFVLFSNSEGCPTVLLEAMHSGCPVITTDVHGVSAFVRDGVNGRIVPPQQEAIKDAIRALATDPDTRLAYRESLLQHPISHRLDEYFSRFTALLESPIHIDVSDPPRVSILIPTFLQADVVDNAIASALMQSFCALEVIVIDDHSPDTTEQVCETWRHDPRFRYVRNDRNLGRVATYRKALYKLARGEWVLMLDGDDYLTDPHFIEAAWNLIHSYPDKNIAFLQAGHVCHHLDGSRPDSAVLPDIEGEHQLLSGAEYLKLVYGTGFFTHLGTFYNRQIAIENNCYGADISSSDMESFLRIALGRDVIVLNSIAGHWVQHGNNASSRLPVNKIAENVRIFREIAELAISQRLLARSEIETALSRYEAHTLAYLYHQSIARDGLRKVSLFKMVRTILILSPRAMFNKRVLRLMLKLARRQLMGKEKQ
jgi:glycosyltransferase involved in cell wall biosynthesis